MLRRMNTSRPCWGKWHNYDQHVTASMILTLVTCNYSCMVLCHFSGQAGWIGLTDANAEGNFTWVDGGSCELSQTWVCGYFDKCCAVHNGNITWSCFFQPHSGTSKQGNLMENPLTTVFPLELMACGVMRSVPTVTMCCSLCVRSQVRRLRLDIRFFSVYRI